MTDKIINSVGELCKELKTHYEVQITEELYMERMEILPPAYFGSEGFTMGEGGDMTYFYRFCGKYWARTISAHIHTETHVAYVHRGRHDENFTFSWFASFRESGYLPNPVGEFKTVQDCIDAMNAVVDVSSSQAEIMSLATA